MDPLCYETMLMNENYNICEELPEYFFEITGIPNSPINTSSQLIYLKRNYPKIISQAHSLLMIPDYILFLLTGCNAISIAYLLFQANIYNISHIYKYMLYFQFNIHSYSPGRPSACLPRDCSRRACTCFSKSLGVMPNCLLNNLLK